MGIVRGSCWPAGEFLDLLLGVICEKVLRKFSTVPAFSPYVNFDSHCDSLESPITLNIEPSTYCRKHRFSLPLGEILRPFHSVQHRREWNQVNPSYRPMVLYSVVVWRATPGWSVKCILPHFENFLEASLYFSETHHNTTPHPVLPPTAPSHQLFPCWYTNHPPPPYCPPSTRRHPAKLTVPSSVENESRSHYNRAGQIPLALSEIEHGEQGAGGNGTRPYRSERVSSTDVTNPPGGIEQAHTYRGRQLGSRQREHSHSFFTSRTTTGNTSRWKDNQTNNRKAHICKYSTSLTLLQCNENESNLHLGKGHDETGRKQATDQLPASVSVCVCSL